MTSRSGSRILRIAIATALAASGPAGHAAESAQLEEIIVTANRREQTVLEVPYNISAVSGDALERSLTIDNADLMRTVASVSVVDRGFRNQGVINGIIIRGLNVDGSALGDYALSTVPTVSTYVNDTPIFANFLLRDIERVEVLRGPQGTLYGSGSLGGTVRYMMRDPQFDEFSGRVQGSVSQSDGSDGTNWTADAVLNMPVTDTLALRLNVSRVDQAGIVDYPNVYMLDAAGAPVAPSGILSNDAEYRRVKDADTAELTYLRASMLWEPSDAFRALLAYQHQEDDVGGRRQETDGLDGFGRVYRDFENGSIQREPSSRDADLASLEMDVEFGFATLTSSTSWYQHDGDSISENTGFYAQNNWLADFYYNHPRPMAAAVRTYSDEAVVQELRLASKSEPGRRFDWVAGLFYMDQDLNSTQDSFLRGYKAWWDAADLFGDLDDLVTGDQDFAYERDETFKEFAVFGELTWHLTDALALTLGARWFDNELENDTFLALPLWADLFPESESSAKFSDDDILFKGNVSWQFREDYLLYGTISEGYRRGGTNAVPTTGFFAEDPGWLAYGPDSVVNYEMGVKGRTGSAQFSAAAFYIDWKDVQINTATPNWGFFAAQNGGDARNMGLELELSQVLTDELRYNLGYSYVDAELRNDVYAPDATTPYALRGQRLPGAAEHTLSLGVDYDLALANGWAWVNNLQAYYQSETENAINDSPRFNEQLDAFGLLHLTTGLDFGRWQARLFVRNLTNEEGVTGLFTEAYMGTSPSQNYYGNGSKQFLVLPRTIGLALTVDF
jgi:outer membrane receptor protein involved in Fe transport